MTDELLEALIAHEASYFEMAATLTCAEYAWFLDDSELLDFRDAHRALRLRDDGRGVEAVAHDVIRYFRSRGLVAVADVDAIAERQGIGAALRRNGIYPVLGDTLAMRYVAENAPPPAAYPIRRIPQTDDEIEVWINTAACDDRVTEQEYLWRRVLACEARSGMCDLFLGYSSGVPAGACSLYMNAGWARVDSVATCAAYRRKGVATAVVGAAVTAALESDASCIYLYVEAKSPTVELYRKLGFAPWELNPLRRHSGR